MQFRRGKFDLKITDASSISSSLYSDSIPTTVSQKFATFWTSAFRPSTAAFSSSGQDDVSLVSGSGSFERLLNRAIQTWRLTKFEHFLVNINIWSTTTYEPDPYEFDPDTQIKFFGVSSVNECLFQGHLVVPFKNISGYITARHHGGWMTLENWLQAWVPTAQASIKVNITEVAAAYSSLVGLHPSQVAIALHLPAELQFKIWDYIIKDCQILHPLSTENNVSTFTKGLTPSPKRRRLRQRAITAMLPNYISLVTDFTTTLDWQFSRVFTQYLFHNNVVEFSQLQQLQEWISEAPLHYLNDISHIRLCLTKDDRLQQIPPNSVKYLFDSLAAAGCRISPDWCVSALAYLPSLKTIEIHLPLSYDHYSPQYVNVNGPCRVVFTNLLIESLFPWVVLPGVEVLLTGAVRTSQKVRFNKLLDLTKKKQTSEPGARFLIKHQREAIRQAFLEYQCSVPSKRRPDTDEEKYRHDRQVASHNKARKLFHELADELMFGIRRFYVYHNTVSTIRPNVPRRNYFKNM
jgi:hypothetical protein